MQKTGLLKWEKRGIRERSYKGSFFKKRALKVSKWQFPFFAKKAFFAKKEENFLQKRHFLQKGY